MKSVPTSGHFFSHVFIGADILVFTMERQEGLAPKIGAIAPLNIVTRVSDFAMEHQTGRVTKEVTIVTFNFTEGL